MRIAVLATTALLRLHRAAAPPPAPTIAIAPGVELPLVSLGTAEYDGAELLNITRSALAMGYVGIDNDDGGRDQVLTFGGIAIGCVVVGERPIHWWRAVYINAFCGILHASSMETFTFCSRRSQIYGCVQ